MLTEITVAGRKTATAAKATHVRELTLADAELIQTERMFKTPKVQRLHDRHHALARAMAEGYSVVECSTITGYSYGRIAALKEDPSFAKLVQDYREVVGAASADFQDRAKSLALTAMEKLADTMEEEDLSPGALLEIAKYGADRSGNAPVTKSVSVNVDLGGRLARARQRLEAASPERATPCVLPEPVERPPSEED